MQILQKVIVKQVLTEKMKQALLSSYEEKQNQLEKEYRQLQFEQKKAERQWKNQSAKTYHFYEKEMEKREEMIKNVEFQRSQLELLPLGSELKEKEAQSIVDIRVGDRWEGTEKTVIVKDGIVIEIR
ncbi:YlqD family protein [Bacillus thermotolerans]|uniref:YlqD family protein n=1 Tax=Bacillus thermotolerans TaxID=1221996 RepID=UPI00057DF646|nr:YlqD family protein [Bacillus thermotolerans]KKB39317.1 hypothetical protein QY97_00219 [Bacillus thermotolerans]